MPWTARILVISNRTLGSRALLDAMTRRAVRQSVTFDVIVPMARGRSDEDIRQAAAGLLAAGLDVEVQIGDSDPLLAVREAWAPSRYDEVIVATFPTHSSRWLAIDLPHRVQRLTGALVTHVVAETPAPSPAPRATPAVAAASIATILA